MVCWLNLFLSHTQELARKSWVNAHWFVSVRENSIIWKGAFLMKTVLKVKSLLVEKALLYNFKFNSSDRKLQGLLNMLSFWYSADNVSKAELTSVLKRFQGKRYTHLGLFPILDHVLPCAAPALRPRPRVPVRPRLCGPGHAPSPHGSADLPARVAVPSWGRRLGGSRSEDCAGRSPPRKSKCFLARGVETGSLIKAHAPQRGTEFERVGSLFPAFF